MSSPMLADQAIRMAWLQAPANATRHRLFKVLVIHVQSVSFGDCTTKSEQDNLQVKDTFCDSQSIGPGSGSGERLCAEAYP